MFKNLTKAFKALEEKGYFAKENFSCCQNCGWHAMTDEEAEKAVFYHEQDREQLIEEGCCYLAWSGDGQEIVDTLQENGLIADWNGDGNTRIFVRVTT